MQPISVFAPYLPIKLHRERDVARKEIGDIFADIIAKRRASGVKENDILQTFIDGKYLRAFGGRPLTESEITGLLIAALFAGMHTSTITSSWTGIFLTHHRAAFNACVEEQRRIISQHGQELSVEVLDEMPVLHACITEALRLHPPLIMMLRYARKAFEVTGALLCSRLPSDCGRWMCAHFTTPNMARQFFSSWAHALAIAPLVFGKLLCMVSSIARAQLYQ